MNEEVKDIEDLETLYKKYLNDVGFNQNKLNNMDKELREIVRIKSHNENEYISAIYFSFIIAFYLIGGVLQFIFR